MLAASLVTGPLPALRPGPTDPALVSVVRDAQVRATEIVGAAAAGRLTALHADARLEATLWFAVAQLEWRVRRHGSLRAGAAGTTVALDRAFCALREEVSRLLGPAE